MARRYDKKTRSFPKRKKKNKGLVTFLILLLSAALCVGAYFLVKDYLKKANDKIEEMTYPRKFSEYVEKYGKEYSVDEAFIYAIIKTESNFDEKAESYVGAKGLMQIMPETFEWLQYHMGDDGEYTEDDLYIPEINIKFGTYFLSYLLELYNGNEKLAAAAYNAGFNCVNGWLESTEYSADGKTLDYIPYDETSNYVDKVTLSRDMYIKLYYS